MYHIFVLIALMASQKQIDKVGKNPYKVQTAKTEQLIPSYPSQPNGDILDQFKKELAKEDEAINKMARDDLESFGLDSVDGQNTDGDFLNTPTNKSVDPKKDSVTKNEATLTGSELEENPKIFETPPKIIETPKTEKTKLVEKKEEAEKEPPLPAVQTPDTITSEAKPVIEDKKVGDKKIEDQKKDENQAKPSIEKPKELPEERPKKLPEKTLDKVNKTDVKAEPAKDNKDTKLAVETSKISKGEEKTPKAKKKSRKEILKEKRQAHIRAVEEAKEEKKLKKLEDLRKKYLVEFDATNEEQNLALDEFQRISSIIPKKKTEPRIINVEVPFQLLDRNRSQDNKYHPIIPSFKEKVNFMFKAIAQGRIDDFNALFDTINQPNLQNSYGDTLLTFSILMQKHGAISSLLTKGANPNLSNRLLYKPMNLAIEMIDYRSVSLLSEMGADVNFVDELGRTYLMQAVRVGSLPIVDFLISKGVDVNKEDKNGMTALEIAYRYNKDIIVKYLLKKGAKPSIEKNIIVKKKSLIEELEHRWMTK